MCIYHEAVRLPGVSAQEALALAVLPGFERGHPFLRWFRENPGSSESWAVKALDQLAVAACDEALVTRLVAFPEDQGKGPEALELLRETLSRKASSRPWLGERSAPRTIYHEAMLLPGLGDEVVVALGALPGYEVRQTCLSWYGENPGSSPEWQVGLFDRLARATCKAGGLSDQLRVLDPNPVNARAAVASVSQALGLSLAACSPLPGSAKKPGCCCG